MNKASDVLALGLLTILFAACPFATATEIRAIATGEIYNFVDPDDILGYGGTGAANGQRVTFYFTFDTETAPPDYYGGARFPLEADYFTNGNSSTAPSWMSSYIEFDNGAIYRSDNYVGTTRTTDQVKIIERDGGSPFDYIRYFDEKVDAQRAFNLGFSVFEYVEDLVDGLSIEQFPSWTSSGSSLPGQQPPDGRFAFADYSAGWAFDGSVMIDSLMVIDADSVNYTIYFSETTGPAGTGSFVFDDCADVVVCPSFSLNAEFGPGLVFETTQLGGNAVFLESFFTGTLQPLPQGTNFDSADGLSLLSFVTTGEYCIRSSAGASGSCSEDPGVFATGTWSLQRTGTLVSIDIKPGSDPNSINLRSKGKIPVAILTTDTFLAFNEVDPLSVEFGPAGATESHGRSHIKDVDDDGDMDMVLHFNTQDTGIKCGDTEATLTGETFAGHAFTGTDSIKIVKCPK